MESGCSLSFFLPSFLCFLSCFLKEPQSFPFFIFRFGSGVTSLMPQPPTEGRRHCRWCIGQRPYPTHSFIYWTWSADSYADTLLLKLARPPLMKTQEWEVRSDSLGWAWLCWMNRLVLRFSIVFFHFFFLLDLVLDLNTSQPWLCHWFDGYSSDVDPTPSPIFFGRVKWSAGGFCAGILCYKLARAVPFALFCAVGWCCWVFPFPFLFLLDLDLNASQPWLPSPIWWSLIRRRPHPHPYFGRKVNSGWSLCTFNINSAGLRLFFF